MFGLYLSLSGWFRAPRRCLASRSPARCAASDKIGRHCRRRGCARLGVAASKPASSPKRSIRSAASASAVRPWMKGLSIAAVISARPFRDCRQRPSTASFTMLLLRSPGPLGISAAMPNTSRAGGCFLALFLLLGFLYGLAIRNPLKGTLIGLGDRHRLRDRHLADRPHPPPLDDPPPDQITRPTGGCP